MHHGMQRRAATHTRQAGKAKKEEDGTARKKDQKDLQMKCVEENRRRKSTTFKSPDSGDFRVAADTEQETSIIPTMTNC